VVTAKDGLRVWDLRRIRAELDQLGLDWDGPPVVGQPFEHDPGSSQARKPDLQIEVDLGELDAGGVQALVERGFAHVMEGEWQKAAADWDRIVRWKPDDHWSWYHSAPLHLQIGDPAGYRQVCREMLARFGNTDNPQIAERVAKTCSLAPDAVPDLGPVLKLADRAVTGMEKNGLYRWFVLAKGMAEYRGGHDAVAVDWMDRFSPRIDGNPSDATAFAVLAMAKHRLSGGRKPPEPTPGGSTQGADTPRSGGADATRLADEARAALGHAEAILAEKMPAPARAGPSAMAGTIGCTHASSPAKPRRCWKRKRRINHKDTKAKEKP